MWIMCILHFASPVCVKCTDTLELLVVFFFFLSQFEKARLPSHIKPNFLAKESKIQQINFDFGGGGGFILLVEEKMSKRGKAAY